MTASVNTNIVGFPGRSTDSAPRARAVGRATVDRVAAAELIKLGSVPSMIYAMAVAVGSIIGIGSFTAFGQVRAAATADATADPTGGALTGVSFAVYAIATLGTLAVTSEYGTGTIRPTLVAVPRRSMLVVGKVLALVAATLPLTLASNLIAFVAAKGILATADRSISLTTPGVARVVIGAAFYLTGVALLSAGLGWLLRNTAGALAALFVILTVLPVIGFFLPPEAGQKIVPYLPNNAGTAVMQLTPGGQLGPWTGLAVFIGYATITLIAATVLLRRRDA